MSQAAAAYATQTAADLTASSAGSLLLMSSSSQSLPDVYATTLTASSANSSIMITPPTIVYATTSPAPSIVDDVDIPDLINNEYVQIFFCILYTTVFVLGVFGNVLVCCVVLRNRAMQTVTNIFITNLALSDILLCVLAVPFTPLYTFMGRWAFGRTLCHLVSFAQGCSIYISTLTLTSIAIDRYFVIIYPFHPRMKLSTCIAIIISIWVVALLATLPYGMYVKVHEVNVAYPNQTVLQTTPSDIVVNPFEGQQAKTISVAATLITAADAYKQIMVSAGGAGGGLTTSPETPSYITTSYCEENWPSEHYRKVFGSVTTILQFILPFFIISICYVWISVKLNARARAKPGSKSSRREEADRDRKKRTNRMLIAMVAVFGLSWLPINVVNIFDDFYEQTNEWPYYTLFFFVAHSIAMSSTCYNPFLYAWLNENFRKEFKHVLPCFNPSNSSLLSITRGYNRSERNTCGPRLIRGGRNGGAGNDGSLEADDNVTQETGLQSNREKLLIIPREATYGLPSSSSASASPRGKKLQPSDSIDMTLKDCRHRRMTDDIDSSDEQTVEVRFCETPFNRSNSGGGGGGGDSGAAKANDEQRPTNN